MGARLLMLSLAWMGRGRAVFEDRPLDMQECFERLTKEWELIEVDEDYGVCVSRIVPALLVQLREAVFGGLESTGGGAQFGGRLPISEGALDLYQAMDLEIAEAWSCTFPGQVPVVDAPERLLSQLVAVAGVDEIVSVSVAEQRVEERGTHREHWWVERSLVEFPVGALLQRWVRQVMDFFSPPRTREIQAACVQCGEEWDWKSSVVGEAVPFRVFVFVQDSHGNTLGVRCFACGLSWGRDKLLLIARAIGAEVPGWARRNYRAHALSL